MLFEIILLVILILVNGIFSAAEMSLLSINKYELNKEIKQGNKKAVRILKLLDDSNVFLSAIQIAITLSNLLASAFAAETFASELSKLVSITYLTQETITSILVVIITIVLSYFTLVFGELLPKRLGLVHSEKIAFMMVGVIDGIIVFFKPFILILKYSVDFFAKLLKIGGETPIKEADLKSNIAEAKLESLEKSLLYNVFEFNDIPVKEIMTKETDMITIDVTEEKKNIVEKLRKHKYTRFPVTKEGKIIGVLNIKDLLINPTDSDSIRKYTRKLRTIDSDMIIDDAFLLLKSKHESIAQVIENEKVIGIVTIEDIIEELVGEIYDEYN